VSEDSIKDSRLRPALVLIGFTSIVAQVVLVRELIVVFYGNEISLGFILANWLLWTALGSGVLGHMTGRPGNSRGPHGPRRLMAGLQVLLGVVLPLTILVVRASRNVFRPTPGEILGPGPMFATSVAVLCLFCASSGMLFAAGSRTYAREAAVSTVTATSSVYLLEAVGSGAGGLLASLVLIRYCDAFQIASLLSLLNFVAAAVLLVNAPWKRYSTVGGLLAIFALFVFPRLSPRLEAVSLRWLWRGFQVVATRNSIYGNLAVIGTPEARTLFENGLAVFTVPNPEQAEEAVHFALLEHPSPRSLLLIGGGMNGSLAQALQHSTLKRVDYVELDPAILELARNYFPHQWSPMGSDPRVHTHHIDGRLFLKTTSDTFDVIIVNVPDPETAQLNRFYTAEFFREAAARLAPTGIFSFKLRGAEDYISPELADFLRCIRKTLSQVFPEVTFIPGATVHFFAAQRAGLLAAGPEDLLSRLKARHLETSYVREYYIPFRMTPDRMLDFDSQTRPSEATPVNRDFAPIAYYFDVTLWSTRFSFAYRRVFEWIASLRFGSVLAIAALAVLAIAGALHWRSREARSFRSAAGFCVATTGFTLMALEVLLLLGFQALFGYVYHQLAVLFSAFMVGMALGSWRALRRPAAAARPSPPRPMLRLARLQLLAAASPLLLCLLLDSFAHLRFGIAVALVSQIVFPLLAICCGWLGGYQFPIASLAFFPPGEPAPRRPGALYALDLVGACAGALLLSAYLVPVFGFLRTALLIAAVNLAPAALAFLQAADPRAHPGS